MALPMDRGVFFALLYFTAVVLVAGLMLLLLSPFLGAIAWAGVIALAAQPVHRWLLRKVGGRTNVAAGLATLAAVLVIAVPFMVLAILFAGEAVGVLSTLESAIQTGRIPGWEHVQSNPSFLKLMAHLEPYLKDTDFQASAMATMRGMTGLAVQVSKAVLLNFFSALLQFFVMVMVLFFAFRDGAEVVKQAWAVVPLKARDKEVIGDTVRRVVNAVLYGIVLTCIVQGILGGIGFAMVGLPSPVFFGALMILAAFIPIVGTGLVWVPGVLYLLAIGDYGRAGILTLWCLAVVTSIDNFVRPFFISGKAKIPILVVALGVLGGLLSLGFLGVILGPLMFAVALELFRIYREEIFPERAAAETAGD